MGGIATKVSVVGVGEAGEYSIIPINSKGRMKPFTKNVTGFIPDKPEITVYSKTVCPACKLTKRWLTEHGFDYTEINIDLQPEYKTELQLYGFQSAPVVAVGSLDNAWTGFRPGRLQELVADK